MSRAYKPGEYEVFCGMDTDKHSIDATFSDNANNERSVKMPADALNIMAYARRHYGGRKILFVYEAGPTGYGLHDDLKAHGYECLITSPASVPRAKDRRVKTNRIDSRTLSRELRGGNLKVIHVPTGPYRELRHLTQLRDAFVSQTVAAKNRIKSLLLFEGIEFPETSTGKVTWGRETLQLLKELPCNGSVKFKLERLIDSLNFAHKNILETTREIRAYCKKEPEIRNNVEYVKSVSGIGYTTAYQLIARIGDWRLIKNAYQVGSFLGLTPSENSTGDTVNRGGVTSAGHSRLRSKLIQCAWTAIRKDPELKEFYERINRRHHSSIASRKAIVATARKLTMRVYAVLAEQRLYQMRLPAKQDSLVVEDTALPQG